MWSQPPKSTMVGVGGAILYTLDNNYRHQFGATCSPIGATCHLPLAACLLQDKGMDACL
jgi:hypothetical protein